jgi:hypothetical protein
LFAPAPGNGLVFRQKRFGKPAAVYKPIQVRRFTGRRQFSRREGKKPVGKKTAGKGITCLPEILKPRTAGYQYFKFYRLGIKNPFYRKPGS